MTDDQDDPSRRLTDREARRAELIGEIAARLRHVCQHLGDDEFARLVADIAETRLRFSAIDAGHFARGRPPQGRWADDAPSRADGPEQNLH